MTIENPVDTARNMSIQTVLELPITGDASKEQTDAIESRRHRSGFLWLHKQTDAEVLKEATEKFEDKNHIPVTGNPSSEKTADLLRATRAETPKGKELNDLIADTNKNQDMVTGVMLSSLGYEGSAIEQVSAFQQKHGRKPTGVLTEDDATDLSKESIHNFSGKISESLAGSIPFGLGGILAPVIQQYIENHISPSEVAGEKQKPAHQIDLQGIELPKLTMSQAHESDLGTLSPSAGAAAGKAHTAGRGA